MEQCGLWPLEGSRDTRTGWKPTDQIHIKDVLFDEKKKNREKISGNHAKWRLSSGRLIACNFVLASSLRH